MSKLSLPSVATFVAARGASFERERVATMHAQSAVTALVSGGFTLFAETLAARLALDAVFANRREIEYGRRADRAATPIERASAKAEALRRLREEHRLAPRETQAVGDGANDLDTLEEAGLGVAHRAKPIVAARAKARRRHADLIALIHMRRGLRRRKTRLLKRRDEPRQITTWD